MTRRTLFELEEVAQRNLDLREGHEDAAPWDAVNKLLGDMASILWDGHGKKWDARARNCNRFASAPSPVAAMRAAVALRDAPVPVRRQLL